MNDKNGYPRDPAFLDEVEKWCKQHKESLHERGVELTDFARATDTSHNGCHVNIDTLTRLGTAQVWESGMADFHSGSFASAGDDSRVEHFEFQSPVEIVPALDAFLARLMDQKPSTAG